MSLESFLSSLSSTSINLRKDSRSPYCVFPETVEEVVTIMQLASTHGIRVCGPGSKRDPWDCFTISLCKLRPHFALDPKSLLLDVDGGTSLRSVDSQLKAKGMMRRAVGTKDDQNIAQWIALGLPGAENSEMDPLGGCLAAIEVVLSDGSVRRIKRAPRKAVGPETWPLFLGAHSRYGIVTLATLSLKPYSPQTTFEMVFSRKGNAESASRWLRGHGLRGSYFTVQSNGGEHLLYVSLDTAHPAHEASIALLKLCAEHFNRPLEPSSRWIGPGLPPRGPESSYLKQLKIISDPDSILG